MTLRKALVSTATDGTTKFTYYLERSLKFNGVRVPWPFGADPKSHDFLIGSGCSTRVIPLASGHYSCYNTISKWKSNMVLMVIGARVTMTLITINTMLDFSLVMALQQQNAYR